MSKKGSRVTQQEAKKMWELYQVCGTDGRVAGVVRLPLVFTITDGIRNHRAFADFDADIQQFDLHQNASFRELKSSERSVSVRA